MAMNDGAVLVLAAAAGLALGAVFFGGLWWTVRRALRSQHAALWFLGSLVLRTSIALGGFYLVSSDRWDRLLACLLGFVVARLVVTRLCGSPVESGNAAAEEAGRAS
jgi:F1F0 ATPase subunit 2